MSEHEAIRCTVCGFAGRAGPRWRIEGEWACCPICLAETPTDDPWVVHVELMIRAPSLEEAQETAFYMLFHPRSDPALAAARFLPEEDA